MLYEVAAGAELVVVADRGGGGGDLAESAVVSGSRVAVVAELAALHVGHVARTSATSPRSTSTRWSPIAAAVAVTSPSRPW